MDRSPAEDNRRPAPGRPRRQPPKGSDETIDLPPGRWEISLSWASSLPIDATIGGRPFKLPPYIGDGERHWRMTSVRGGRPLEVIVVPGPERRFDVPRAAQIGRIAAVREGVKGHFVPIARACGRYVDWIEYE